MEKTIVWQNMKLSFLILVEVISVKMEGGMERNEDLKCFRLRDMDFLTEKGNIYSVI